MVGAFNGNCEKRKETIYISMARAHFKSYIMFFGEPHRHVRQKSDGQNVEVICLPMNVRQSEVWTAINNASERMGETKFGLSTFKKCPNKNIPMYMFPLNQNFQNARFVGNTKEVLKQCQMNV